MGSQPLASSIERVWFSAESYPFEVCVAPPGSLRLIDDLRHCDARGATRQLHMEAKGFELLAAWMDHLETQRDASSLSSSDVACLERARRALIARMTDPLSLPELARLVGLNEA